MEIIRGPSSIASSPSIGIRVDYHRVPKGHYAGSLKLEHSGVNIAHSAHSTSQPVKKWQVAAAKDKNGIAARGTFPYTSPDYKGERTVNVAYTLSVQNDFSLYGRSSDSTGEADIYGSIDPHNGTIQFLKNYTKHIHGESVLLWDYEGCFMQCEIVGEWRYPKGHALRGSTWRGRFNIWLKDEEDDSKEQMEDQL
ncbi:MAG: hypothetical protein Q9220_000334 [cf. Caloplaca sp. 1 TL-2023]